jgi:DNA-binding PadR family transcriptional regulator
MGNGMLGRKSGILKLKVLESLAGAATGTADLFLAIIESGYGASLSRMEWNRRKIRSERTHDEELRRQRQRFYELISRLKHDGIIESTEKRGNRVWLLTKRGMNRLLHLREGKGKSLPRRHYTIERASEFKIVIFDVPERDRRKRGWLRFELGQLGFTMIQKSVWVGNVKVPESFIKDLSLMGLIPYVELFAITKSGSLRNLAK